MNANPKPEGKTETLTGVGSSELLDGWAMERKWYGVGRCFSRCGPVLSRGKWGVVGDTGCYRILHPDGWVNDTPTFPTELEAMRYVMNKEKPSNDPSSATRRTGRNDCNHDAPAGLDVMLG
jgi:hypothetical protein